MKRRLALLSLLVVAAMVAAENPLGAVKDFALLDPQGRKHSTEMWKAKKAVVLVFLGTECPLSNGYASEYRRLVETYGGKGVLFYGVHPDPDVGAKDATRHAGEYRLPFAV